MKQYAVAVVGIGLVGSEMLKVLRERNFPAKSYKVLATRERIEEIGGYSYEVVPASVEAFQGVDIAFFAGTEGAKGASQLYGWAAVEKGVVVIDKGDDFRMDPRVPLIVPEVNPHHLKSHQGVIASPNCSTIPMVIVLAPLHQRAKIKRVVVSTYQSVSGSGRSAVVELEGQIQAYQGNEPMHPEVYPHPIAFNLIPEISSLKPEYPGYYGEEVKMIRETRKILDEPTMAITATCVRVPVFNAHSEAINIEFEEAITPEEVREILAQTSGVKVLDSPEKHLYPTPREVSGKDEVYVGRIRKDPSVKNGIDLWVVGDNIRKGAALNAAQIAEKMIEMELI
ncbi:MAG: aspartate-semialdehyde dehydrogenase [Candidatus Tectomicrobia bacterium]|nr:aspartate-semialdehyde dehydrogenase [Candidatus Tectomicrobia bacterium]